MGAFSRALKDAQYLQPLSQAILNYKQKQQEEEGRKQLFAIMQELQNKEKQYSQPITQDVFTPDKGQFEVAPKSLLEGVMRGGSQNTITPEGKTAFTDKNTIPLQPNQVTPELPYTPKTRPEILKPGEIQQNMNKVETYNPAKNPADWNTYQNKMRPEISKVFTTMLTNPNIDQAKALQLADVFTKFGMQQAPVKPDVDYKEVDGNLLKINKTSGEVIPVYQKKQANEDKEISTYTGEDNYQYTTMKRKDGTTYEIKSTNTVRQPKGNNVSVSIINPSDNLGKLTEGYSKIDGIKQQIEQATPNAKGEIKINVDGREHKGTPKKLRLLINEEKTKYKRYAREMLFDQGYEKVYSKITDFGAERLKKYDFNQFMEMINDDQRKSGLPEITDPDGVLKTAYDYYRL